MAPEGVTVDAVDHGNGPAYLAQPGVPGRGALPVLPMITGIGRQVREFAHEFASAGFTTLCWDPFDGASTDTHTVEHSVACGIGSTTAECWTICVAY